MRSSLIRAGTAGRGNGRARPGIGNRRVRSRSGARPGESRFRECERARVALTVRPDALLVRDCTAVVALRTVLERDLPGAGVDAIPDQVHHPVLGVAAGEPVPTVSACTWIPRPRAWGK